MAHDQQELLPVWFLYGQGYGGPTIFGIGRCSVVGGGRRQSGDRGEIIGLGVREEDIRIGVRVESSPA
jgi:hypothetical protein